MSEKRYKEEEVVEAIFEANGVITDAAKRLGCDPRTIYRYATEYEAVAGAMVEARKGLVEEAKGYLVSMMRSSEHKDHYKAVMKILTTYDGETDWSDRQQITGASGGPLMLRWSDED